MIFVTVGGQMPFDRLIRAVDAWHRSSGRELCIQYQIGDGRYLPESGSWVRFLDALEFNQRMKAASLIVAHAGMGSILTALELGKPILVMPRLGRLQETRNDHQVATASALRKLKEIHVALDEVQLKEQLSRIDRLHRGCRVGSWASPELQAAISEFILGRDRDVHEDGRSLLDGKAARS